MRWRAWRFSPSALTKDTITTATESSCSAQVSSLVGDDSCRCRPDVVARSCRDEARRSRQGRVQAVVLLRCGRPASGAGFEQRGDGSVVGATVILSSLLGSERFGGE